MTTTEAAPAVRTGLFIGGEERSTADVLQVADPGQARRDGG